MGRPPCCDKSHVKKGLWTAEEDAKLLAYVAIYGVGNWTLIPKKAGLNRCGKSCRLRWTNYLRPDLKHDSFSPQEEETIIMTHKAVGSRWSLIAKSLPGRTDNDVKNYWNTRLKKKLIKMGIDPVTHRPVSQVLTDYGNISSCRNPVIPNGSFGNNFDSTLIPTPEQSNSVLNSVSTVAMITNPVISQLQETDVATILPSEFLHQYLAINSQDTTPSHFLFNEATSSCSSSSSSANIIPETSFRWSEFLLPDPSLRSDEQHQQHELESQGILSSASSSSKLVQNEMSNRSTFNTKHESNVRKLAGDCSGACDDHGATSSFVDAILDHDSEIRSQFPQLSDAFLDY